MGEQDTQRRVAHYRLDRLVAAEAAAPGRPGPPSEEPVPGLTSEEPVPRPAPGGAPGQPRPRQMASRGAFADELVRQAMARGDFDDLPLTGKPIPGLTGRHDPDWWLKAFIEREQITGVLPEALQLRKDDVALDGWLDRESVEDRVREVVAEFNARIVEARRQLLGGPPVITPTRDVEVEVRRWCERRRARQDAESAAEDERAQAGRAVAGRGRWWRRARGRACGADERTDPATPP